MYLSDARARVDAVLERWGNRSEELWPPPVPAAVRYSLLSAGKRLRPTLVFAAYEAVGGGAPGVAELAASIEVVHAYSLVHDDLPCMDNDDLRRGRPTTHRAFDVRTATEAGYHMVALAARVLAAGLDALGLALDRRRAIALELYRAAGGGGGAARGPSARPAAARGVSFSYPGGAGALHCHQAELNEPKRTRNAEVGTRNIGESSTWRTTSHVCSAFRVPTSALGRGSMALLESIRGPDDVRRLERAQLQPLADEVRRRLIDVVSQTGGHIGAGLGVVELTVALCHCFDSPRDKIVWDVGHQAYPWKILTGRNDRL